MKFKSINEPFARTELLNLKINLRCGTDINYKVLNWMEAHAFQLIWFRPIKWTRSRWTPLNVKKTIFFHFHFPSHLCHNNRILDQIRKMFCYECWFRLWFFFIRFYYTNIRHDILLFFYLFLHTRYLSVEWVWQKNVYWFFFM